jgi:hypothetical protein
VVVVVEGAQTWLALELAGRRLLHRVSVVDSVNRVRIGGETYEWPRRSW